HVDCWGEGRKEEEEKPILISRATVALKGLAVQKILPASHNCVNLLNQRLLLQVPAVARQKLPNLKQLRIAVTSSAKPPEIVFRHSAMIRLSHWVGVVCVTLLLLSGLQIFNAHPALYLGQASDFAQPIASIGVEQKEARQIGVTNILGYSFDTTGFLGLSGPANEEQHAFPFWLTLPGYQDLATGRRWHFFFAWLLVLNALIYLIYSLV